MPAASLDEIKCPLKGLSLEACEDIDFFKDKGTLFLLADLSRMTLGQRLNFSRLARVTPPN